jgi:nucleoside-diphosphate-sugar epimerase
LNILVTGSSGFIGNPLCLKLSALGHSVLGTVREKKKSRDISGCGFNICTVQEIGLHTKWKVPLHGIECIVHCAARAHVLHESESDPLLAFRSINVDGTRVLAEQAVRSGVRRLVYISSIGVHGSSTNGAETYNFSDSPAPIDDYAISKYEAEEVLNKISLETDLEVVIVRPPLVYGPNVKGNFLRLLQLVERGGPLPFGSINNKRSLVGVDNLVDMLINCVINPQVTRQTLLVSDNADISTPEILRKLSNMMGMSPRLINLPISWLRFIGKLSGRLPEIERITNSLQVDISNTCNVLKWHPKISVEEGFKKTVDWFLHWKKSC